MRKLFKKISVLAAAAVLAAGSASLAACSSGSVSVAPDTSANSQYVTSNGGFVVTTGDYYYFINGVEAYTADNTYGKVVKGSLMRQKKSALAEDKNESEIVVPSLISASDYSAGIYIYGEGASARVYYATPNNVKNTSGKVENDYLDFKSTALDGKDTKTYFRASTNDTVYRFVEVENTVYVLYVDGSDLHSYNTATGTDTLLVSSMSAYVLNSTDKTDPYVYYTMPVTGWVDSDDATQMKYNQIYRVRADATTAAHEIEFDEEWVKNENEGKEPYHNYGSIVLDGIGKADTDFDTRFSPDYTTENELPAVGYSYTLQAYTNGGIYFKRSLVNSTSSELYYLAVSSLGESWDSIRDNSVYKTDNTSGKLEVVANSVNAANAGTAAIFYIEEDSENNVKHHYLYVKDSAIYRADVINDGKGLNKQYSSSGDLKIAFNESGATLVSLDNSGATYHYLYYTKTSGSGRSVDRVPYNGTEANYTNLTPAGATNEEYKTATVAGVQHASTWYNYEIIDNVLFYANAETVGTTSYNYIYTVDLNNESGSLMSNAELEAFNDKYDLVMGDEGYLAKVTKDYANLSAPIKYYFYTGENGQFWTNIKEAVDNGKKETHLYSQEEQDIFKAFSEGKDNDFVAELNGDGAKYRVQSAFMTFIGQKSETDTESEKSYWETALANYQVPEKESGLAWWAWLLIGLAIAAVVAGVAVPTVLVLVRKKKNAEKEPVHKMAVDTSDDKDIDVYAANEEHLEAENAEEATEEPAEAEEPEAETPSPDEPKEE